MDIPEINKPDLPEPALAIEIEVKAKLTEAELMRHQFKYGEMDSIHEAVNLYLH